MKPLFLTICILSVLFSQAQEEKLGEFRNKILCNVYDYQHADRTTNRFLRANFPYLAQPRPEGGISMPPIGVNSNRQIVSMKFGQHPFFNFKMKEGRIDFHAIIMSPTDKFEHGADCWLIFENEQDAKTAFKMLTDTLASLSKDMKATKDPDQTTVMFTATGKYNYRDTVKLILKKDEQGNYAICLPSNYPD